MLSLSGQTTVGSRFSSSPPTNALVFHHSSASRRVDTLPTNTDWTIESPSPTQQDSLSPLFVCWHSVVRARPAKHALSVSDKQRPLMKPTLSVLPLGVAIKEHSVNQSARQLCKTQPNIPFLSETATGRLRAPRTFAITQLTTYLPWIVLHPQDRVIKQL